MWTLECPDFPPLNAYHYACHQEHTDHPKGGTRIKHIASLIYALRMVADELEALYTTDSSITIEQVRKVLVDKSRAGHTDAIHKLLESFGVQKLSALPTDKYEALLRQVEELE
ncbi:hypothetical protein FACS1894184_09200 [Clostridia bacterium]|nr:hypothetical protein FACS1894184_09200 [Clostridia bacterium]